MKATNTKMKLLSLAILGLGGIALAGSASAGTTCPSTPDAWSGVTQTQGAVGVANTGYDGTSCSMTSVISSGASGFASATVRDDSPSAEPTYRAQFIIDATNLTGLGAFSGAQIFSATSSNAYLGTTTLVKLAISGGSSKTLNISAADEGATGNISNTSVSLLAGVNRIEINLQTGAAGSLAVWVNNTDANNPTTTLSGLNNAGWAGVDRATMGLSGTNNLFRQNNAGQVVNFDQFDSRRTTFIGH